MVTYSGTADDDEDEVAAGVACRPPPRPKTVLPQTGDRRHHRRRFRSCLPDPSGVSES